MLLVGLLTAGILYPLLHEAGHWAATLLLGGEILEFHLLPRPNVLCEVAKIGGAKCALIGLCGMALPFAAAVVVWPRRFTTWYVLLLLRGISAFALVLSLISVIGRDCGITIMNDDVLTVLRFRPQGGRACAILLTAWLIMAVYGIFRQRPIKKFYMYFEVVKSEIAMLRFSLIFL